jgi:hypothetical protein
MQTDTDKPNAPNVLSGLLDRTALGKQLGPAGAPLSDRTIIRYERAGMPFISVGMLRLYDAAKVREWLVSHEHRQEGPRRPGRPAARKAA